MSGDRPDELVDRAYRVGEAVTATPPAAAASPAGDRRVAILVLGIIQIVLGALCGVGALVCIILMSSLGGVPVLAAALVYGIPAANFLVTGIGSVKITRWARRATLISAFVWLALIGIAGGVVAFGPGRGMGYEVFLLQGFLVMAVAIAIVLIVFYTRPAVRATFERGQAP